MRQGRPASGERSGEPEEWMTARSGWRVFIDRGGTFTDVVGRAPSGEEVVLKLLSVDPGAYEDAALAGISQLLGIPDGAPIPPGALHEVRIGTTIATNALLERRGAPTALVVTRGFSGLPAIGRQARPDLFSLNINRPAPLYQSLIVCNGRVSVSGERLSDPDWGAIERDLGAARSNGAEACAISLIHGWRFPEMEEQIARIARNVGFAHVRCGHEASPLPGYLPRTETVLADAYLAPAIDAYVDRLRTRLGATPLLFMQSNGGLCPAERFSGRNAVLSGPAGGAIAAARTSAAAGFEEVIAFDMGGTSTDVSVHAGRIRLISGREVSGVALRSPTIDIHTVAAGGGSILRFDGGRFLVGPRSAGADPGPACYRRGGPLTVTCANLLLGRIRADAFPRVFGPDRNEGLDIDHVRDLFVDMARKVSLDTGTCWTAEEVAEGFLTVAVGHMARAIKQVTLEQGHDPGRFMLSSFGGAGGQHACRIAEDVGMAGVIIHPSASVLSAVGIGLADEILILQGAVEAPLDAAGADIAAERVGALCAQAAAQSGAVNAFEAFAEIRANGADAALSVPIGAAEQMQQAFAAEHLLRFGVSAEGRSLHIESVRLEALTSASPPHKQPGAGDPEPVSDRPAAIRLYAGGAWRDGVMNDRTAIAPGTQIAGPALIIEKGATTVIEPGWSARRLEGGELLLTPSIRSRHPGTAELSPARLELFHHLFMSVAERMGAVLANTSTSVNIRERLDFSCALFDAEGRLIANAPHVPVHLGAMGDSIRTVIRRHGDGLRPGDMYAVNNPFDGGTHLPDVTMVAPVFDMAGSRLRYFVANRGHHADIGGSTPGSTPPFSRRLEEEGVVLDCLKVVTCDGMDEALLRSVLSEGPWPARNPAANIMDISAQAAACRAGIEEMSVLIDRHGWATVSAFMDHIRANAAQCVRRLLDRLDEGSFRLPLDDGGEIAVDIAIDRIGRRARIDFTGTSQASDSNFNAPPSVARAATLFVLRCLVDDDIPLNDGCLEPVDIILPQGSRLNPPPGSAVVAGNTEISQAVANALLGACGAVAASQGTMNNLLIGNDRFQYYETICGGAGAGPNFAGASGVHTHMTNTRITDPEVLEMRYPLRLEAFEIRGASGGGGAFPGGDGVRRSIRVLEPAHLSLLASSRRHAPHGLSGGGPGRTGAQYVESADGERIDLPGVCGRELRAGDIVTVETPGGGGYGRP